jgi:3-dehydrosphinganine reductase
MIQTQFSQQHAIVTGGSSGIGLALAKLLATQGANVSIIARTQEKLDAAVREIEVVRESTKQRVLALSADVADRASIEGAIATAIDRMGAPDLLVTSAGIAHPGYFQDLPIAVFEETMAIDYFGTLYSIKAALPAMVARQKGQIVLISSGAGLIGIYGYTPYCPSKFAVRGLAESLRGELKPMGIGVCVVYPPDTDTPQLAEENKTKPLETQQITGTAQTWTAEAVAREIVRGVVRRSFAIAPGLEMSLLSRLHSLLSPVLQWYFDRIVEKTAKNSDRL